MQIDITRFMRTALIIFLLFIYSSLYSQFYNGSQLNFGKNRVQYNNFFWTYYRFKKFDVYFYLNGKELAIYTAEYAKRNIKGIEKKLETDLENKIQFIVFNNLSDLKQSNIGLISDEQYNIGGITHIIGNKVFLYFDGNHINLERQIRSGIAEILLNQMIYGKSIGSKIKNKALVTLPQWYKNGLISYIADNWNTEIDNHVRDGILSGRYKKFNRLTQKEVIYAGHSIWKFIADKYGKSSISNIVYTTKVSKSVESGFLYVLGISYKSLLKEWLSYYEEKYSSSDAERNLPSINPLLKRFKPNLVYRQLKISPDGKYAAFFTNQLGQYKIYLYNLETKKVKKIFKSGYKLKEKIDYSYPLIEWHPTAKLLSFIIEAKGQIYLYLYTIKNHKLVKRIFHRFEKILDYSYSNDSKYYVLSAVQKGKSDIFVYDIASNTYEQITKDVYDDLHPRFINNSKDIIFASNRIDDTIKFEENDTIKHLISNSNTDLFLYNYSKRSNVLRRITNTLTINETLAEEYKNGYISYLGDNNGIYNRYIAHFDSSITYIDTTTHYRYFTESFPVTNYSRSIIEQDISPQSHKYAEIIYDDGVYKMYISDLLLIKNLSPVKLKNTSYRKYLIKEKALRENLFTRNLMNEKAEKAFIKNKVDSTITKQKKYPKRRKRFVNVRKKDIQNIPHKQKIDINNYNFKKQSFISINENIRDSLKNERHKAITVEKISKKFKIPKKLNYDVEYSINQLMAQANFAFLNYSYQPFTGGGSPIYLNPGFGAFLKAGVTDLLENFRIVGGVKLSSNLKNNEYVVSYSNLKNRLDKQIVFHRKIMEENQEYSLIKHTFNELYYILKWPFNQVMCVKGTVFYKNERASYLSTDPYNLIIPDSYKNWTGLKGEFIFDDTRKAGLNIYYGTRYKLWSEYYQLIHKNSKNLFVLGLDYRNYQKIHRTFIWANRFASSISFGKNKLIYYLGGVDNWINPHFDRTTPIDYSQNYTYQALATNMRGFNQNIRNGTSFFVINSELRLPVFRYLANRPLKLNFLNDFQIVGFGDLGSAWTGFNPFSEHNTWFTNYVNQGPIRVKVQYQKAPLIAGYGCGLRSRIFGYFVRADYAWGVEDNKILKPMFYLSLNLDF